ncbi:unnamed protein product [Medioppia subpectinata]|uniref:Phytanoyl-CoA dioxygenase n=1 Tax=Medioppia subpectinata TaxID=1979941 RepID=A0A7R9KK63_9ACAR|nr:unnamed protein product [Medioppia subpectinata]CAG2104916.1 unnamed protein product [Medioppia subpectinata]
MSEYLTQQIVDDYRRDGAVCIRNVFNNYWIEKVIEGIERNLKNPSDYSESLSSDGQSGAFFNDYCNWRSIPEFEQYVYQSPAAQICAALMDSEYSVFYHEHVLIKEAAANQLTPWHHDQAYYPINGFKNCSIWMPLDPVPIETAVEFAAASHLDNKWYKPRKFATHLNYNINNNDVCDKIAYNDVPSDQYIRDNYKILSFDVKPGDCIAFHMRTLHGAPGNLSESTSRRVLSTRWLGDDAVIGARPWITSPPTTGGLDIGQNVIQSKEFPLIWTRSK